MNAIKRPVLITGSHRSGTTWVGHMLRQHPELAYIFEPFNIEMNHLGMGVCEAMERNYLYISEHNEAIYKPRIDKLLRFKYPGFSNLIRARSVRALGKSVKDIIAYQQYRSKHQHPLIKDPLAFFSAPWLANTYDARVIVLIRHPAAFCSSLKVKNWQFNYRNFLDQPELMEKYLHPFESEIKACEQQQRDIIDQGILVWNCIHHCILQYQQAFNHWQFIRHEDLSMEPEKQFEALCKAIDIEFTDVMRQAVLESSGSHNPQEQSQNEFIRDSRKNIKNWQSRLSEEEINRIRIGTESISSHFYHDEDW